MNVLVISWFWKIRCDSKKGFFFKLKNAILPNTFKIHQKVDEKV